MVELRTKVKYLVPVAITTTDAAAKLKNLQKQKLDINKFSSILQKWIYLHLNKMGLRLPEDVSLIGVGDKIRHSVLQQHIASVTVDESQLGNRAAELLNKMRCGEIPIEATESYIIPAEVYKGTTLGAITETEIT